LDAAEVVGTTIEGWEHERTVLATNFNNEVRRLGGELRDAYRPLIASQLDEEGATRSENANIVPTEVATPSQPKETTDTLLQTKLRQRKAMCIRYNGHPDGHLPSPKSASLRKWGD